jgi:hypothetical protein
MDDDDRRDSREGDINERNDLRKHERAKTPGQDKAKNQSLSIEDLRATEIFSE